MLTDKYRVRAWVADKVGEKYLVPLCGKGVYDSPYDIAASVVLSEFELDGTREVVGISPREEFPPFMGAAVSIQ